MKDEGLIVEKVIHVTVFRDGTVDVVAYLPSGSSLDPQDHQLRLATPDEVAEFVRKELVETKWKFFGENFARTRSVLKQHLARQRRGKSEKTRS